MMMMMMMITVITTTTVMIHCNYVPLLARLLFCACTDLGLATFYRSSVVHVRCRLYVARRHSNYRVYI